MTEEAAGCTSGDKKTGKEEKLAATLAEAGFINVHLKMPGVPLPVDIMVSDSFKFYDNCHLNTPLNLPSSILLTLAVDLPRHGP